MRTRGARVVTRPAAVAAIAMVFVALVASVVLAAVAMTGRFTTTRTRGAISYSPVRAFRGGSEGTFVVAQRSYPGALYAARGGGLGLVWYYGYSGIAAGNALVTRQPNGTYSGPIWFFDRNGNTIDSGTVTVAFQ